MTHASTIDLVRTTVSVGEDGALRVGRPMHAGTLSIFPLYHAAPPSSYLLYTDVGPTGRVAVTEVDEAGSVPDLVVINQGLTSGEQVVVTGQLGVTPGGKVRIEQPHAVGSAPAPNPGEKS